VIRTRLSRSVFLWGVVCLGGSGQALARQEPSTYVGAAACAACHADVHAKWDGSRHSKMVQPATPASVKGDFSRESVTLKGGRYRLRTSGGQYYVSETYLKGKEQEHHVDYALGNRRIQHYLTTLDDGKIIVLPPTWDVLRKEWFHNLDIVNPDETDRVLVQLWNKNCYSCHVSQQAKNYDAEKGTYDTRWLNFGTNCERCHGPGAKHLERYQRPELYGDGPENFIVRQTRLDPNRNTMVCAQCHSLRDITASGFSAGADYYDYFLPLLEYSQTPGKDPTYWPDGRTRRFSNDALGLWQSQCFLQGGAVCTGCHVDVHDPEIEKNPRLRPGENGLCTRCHVEIGQNVAQHTHHPSESPGSACVECHMPRTVFSIKAAIRDHSISPPAPENTIRHGIPNACNVCHKDKSPEWALAFVERWYPGGARQKLIRRADAFAGARAGDTSAIAPLAAIFSDPDEGPLVRANALGHLARRFMSNPRALPVLLQASQADHPLIRAVAALTLGEAKESRDQVMPSLVHALSDSNRTVRMSAALSLLNLGVTRLDGEARGPFEAAKQDYLARADINSDDPIDQADRGKFHMLNGQPAPAAKAFEASLRLEPNQPAVKFYLALAELAQNRPSEAKRLLAEIPTRDPLYPQAKGLLQKLEKR